MLGPTPQDTRSTQFVWSDNQLMGECLRAGTQTETATYIYTDAYNFVPIAWLDNLHEAANSQATNDDYWPGKVNVYHLHADQIGTPRELTSHCSGKLAWQAQYRTWGNTLIRRRGCITTGFGIMIPV